MLRFSEDDDEAGVDDDDDDDDVDDVDDVKIVVHPKHFPAIAKSHRQVAAALEAKEVLICFQLSRVFSRQRTILHRIHGHGIFTILYLYLPQVFAKCSPNIRCYIDPLGFTIHPWFSSFIRNGWDF